MSSQLRGIADAYFNGLRNKDVSPVPYADDAKLRTPLAPGGSDAPIQGRQAIRDFFAGIYDALGAVEVLDYFYNEQGDAVAVQARVGLANGATLHVADVFRINSAGHVIEQQNHYDPRPALG